MAREPRGVSLKWRISGIFVGLILILGLLVVGIVYQLMGRALRGQIDQRASVIAINLSDSAAGYVLAKKVLHLDALVIKHARLEGVAYAFIEDRKGEIVAHSLGTFPQELQDLLTRDERGQADRRVLKLRGKTVYETRMPILEGQVGFAHVGIWGDAVEQEIYQALIPIVGVIAIVFLAAVILSFFLTPMLIRPIRRLTDIAGKMSMGDLETSVGGESRDEVGELARSLERMRASLKAALLRLKHT